MASPQKENGYTAIANELLEAMARYPFTGREWRVIAVVQRLTYGWNRKSAGITVNQVASRTGLTWKNTRRIVEGLIAECVLTRNSAKLGIQKDYERWTRRPDGRRARPARPPGHSDRGQSDRGLNDRPPVTLTGDPPVNLTRSTPVTLTGYKERKTVKDSSAAFAAPASPSDDRLAAAGSLLPSAPNPNGVHAPALSGTNGVARQRRRRAETEDKPTAEYQPTVALYFQAFRTRFEADPDFTAADGKILKDLLRAHPAEEVQRLLAGFVRLGTSWTRQTGDFSVRMFKREYNTLLVMASRGDL